MGVSLHRTKVSHSASETVIQHSSVRQHVVLDEADLEIKVFLEAAFQHVGLGQKKKKLGVSTKVVFPLTLPTLISCLAVLPVTFGACERHDDPAECHY